MSTNWSEKGTILLEKLVRKRYYFGNFWYYMAIGNTEKDYLGIANSNSPTTGGLISPTTNPSGRPDLD